MQTTVIDITKYDNLEKRFEGFAPKSVDAAYDELSELYSDIKNDIDNCEKDTYQYNILKDRKRFIVFALAYYKHVLDNQCGYWGVCFEHHYGCGCSPSAEVNQGFHYKTYDSMRKEYFRS